jgi:selenocysteine-specific elongation factor
VVAALIEGEDVESSGEVLRLKGKGRTLTAGEETLRVQLLAKISAAGLGPPRLEELASNLSLPSARVQELMKVAVADRLVVRVTDDLYFDRKTIEHLQERLIAHLQQHKEISTQTFKDLVGQSRKYVIPLSEFFDREKVTLRVGEKRVLRRS